MGMSHPLMAQSHEVSGNVISSDTGEALPGVNILVKGTATGTTTDLDGAFSLTAPSANDTLVFSFIGYERLEEAINGRSVVDITLNPQAIAGDELVVVGYGAVQRRDITGSVSSISSEDIQEVPVTDMGSAIQGRVPGVTVLSSGNRPGSGSYIRVRGRRSLTASNDPLFVVDGIPMEGGIDDINPRDIESMEVLKDASATAIYGSRGANGVVLVTTSRGGNHATQVSYSGYAGISRVLGTPDMMNAEEFAQLKRDAGRGIIPAEEEALANGVNTDWLDLFLDDGYKQSHQLSIRGGNENTRFAVSGNFLEEGGVISHQDYNRNTFRINLDHDVSDRFRIGTSTQLSRRVQNVGSNPYGAALAASPLAEPRDADGNLVLNPLADPLVVNPLLDLADGAFIDERSRIRIFSNIFAELDLLENLSYRVNFGPDFKDYRRGLFQGSMTTARNGGSPLARKEHDQEFTYTFENILTYIQDFGGIHSVNLTGLFSIQEYTRERTNLQSSELPYESQKFHNIGTGATIEDLYSQLDEWGMMSFMARANYQLMDRYLVTVTGRYDGSSRLAEGNKWGFFPSVALGWRISDESFMADQNLFSELRLRASYGIAGNTAINPYETRGGLERTAYNFGGSSAFGYRPSGLANPDLVWETSATANVGLDIGLWDDRVVAALELYQTNTTDLLLERQLPITSGFGNVLENIGETQNRGIEINITSRNVTTSNFDWTSNLSLGANKEKIIDLYGTKEDDPGSGWFIDEALTIWYDYDKIGIWQLDEADEAASYGYEPGQIKVRDVNGDGTINEQDRVVIGSDMPVVTLGFGNRFRIKDFDLSVFLFGSFGHTIVNAFREANSTLQGRYNNLDTDYWTPDNPTNDDPQPDATFERPQFNSSRQYFKGDFLKVQNVQLGYNLPPATLETLGIRSARIYLNADTPLIFSHLDPGLDPEERRQSDGRGVITADSGPASRLFSFGINIDF